MKIDKSFERDVIARSGQNISACYQCLKCFVGCPLAPYMDYKPNSIIRMIQYGQREKVLKSHAVWLCVSCMTCGTRCPNEVDMSGVFDTLREMSREAGWAHAAERTVVILHEEFVRNVKIWGRLHEISFFIPHMLRSLDLFSNLQSGVTLMLKGKLPLVPKRIRGIAEIRKVFKQGHKTRGEMPAADSRPAQSDDS